MAHSALPSLGAIRLVPGIEVGEVREVIWLRGGRLEKSEKQLLELVPWENRYEIIDGKYLRPAGALLPIGRIPTCTWTAIASYLQPTLGTTLLPGMRSSGLPLQWVTAREERKPGFLLVQERDWLAFAERAPEVRLKHLKFAQSSDHLILISGSPSPPLPGTYFYEQEGIALPAGYEIEPRLSRRTWQHLLQLGEKEMGLVYLDGTHAVISASAWIPATRSAVRLSLNEQFHV